MSDPIRLEDLRLVTPQSTAFRQMVGRAVLASEVASVLSDADLIGELVRRGVLVKGGYLTTEDGVEMYEWRTEWRPE